MCPIPRCERIFPDEVALDQHYREYHCRLLPENAEPSTLNDYQTTSIYQDALIQHSWLQANPGTVYQGQSLSPSYDHNDLAQYASDTGMFRLNNPTVLALFRG